MITLLTIIFLIYIYCLYDIYDPEEDTLLGKFNPLHGDFITGYIVLWLSASLLAFLIIIIVALIIHYLP